MLTDSASAIKYWYFIRLMGKEPSHLALECALKTGPNMCIVAEECVDRKETLRDIVNNLCDQIVTRSNDNRNYGCVLIPEGLLSQISSFDQMIVEMNKLFKDADTFQEQRKLAQKLSQEEALSPLLTPWSYSLYSSLPDFFKKELLFEREVAGSLKLSQIETERLISYLVGEELAKRKKAGTYTGSFAPVTHFFGYQGRSAHPSHFDCSLGSTCGYAAARLIAAGVTGMCVSVKGIT